MREFILILLLIIMTLGVNAEQDLSEYYFTGEIDPSRYKQFSNCGYSEEQRAKFHIFDNKIIAECHSETGWYDIGLKDGEYELVTQNRNNISVAVNDGKLLDLVIKSGSLDEEGVLSLSDDSCRIASFLMKYKLAYGKVDYVQYLLGTTSNEEDSYYFDAYFYNIYQYKNVLLSSYYFQSKIGKPEVRILGKNISRENLCFRFYNKKKCVFDDIIL